MIRTEYGFLVEIGKAVLISGNWGSDDCEWRMDDDNHYFLDRDEAEKFFKKSKKVFKDGSADRVIMYHCDMDFAGNTMLGCGLGDPIKEYMLLDNGKIVVNEDL